MELIIFLVILCQGQNTILTMNVQEKETLKIVIQSPEVFTTKDVKTIGSGRSAYNLLCEVWVQTWSSETVMCHREVVQRWDNRKSMYGDQRKFVKCLDTIGQGHRKLCDIQILWFVHPMRKTCRLRSSDVDFDWRLFLSVCTSTCLCRLWSIDPRFVRLRKSCRCTRTTHVSCLTTHEVSHCLSSLLIDLSLCWDCLIRQSPSEYVRIRQDTSVYSWDRSQSCWSCDCQWYVNVLRVSLFESPCLSLVNLSEEDDRRIRWRWLCVLRDSQISVVIF
jgi:hypothetical protein